MQHCATTSRHASLAGDGPHGQVRLQLVHSQPGQVPQADLGEVLLVSLVLQLFALVSPLFFQVVMDKVLVHRGLSTLDVLVIGLVVVVAVREPAHRAAQPTCSATPPAASMWSWAHACSATCWRCRWPTSRRAGWAIRWPACASWKTSAAFSPATP
jgi:hypothetical protein